MNHAVFDAWKAGSGRICISRDQTNFEILIGRFLNLLPFTIWLVSNIDDLNTSTVAEEVLLSGIKLGIPYCVWVRLDRSIRDKLRPNSHIFTSMYNWWNLVFGWSVCCAPSGCTNVNWLFRNNNTYVLVSVKTSFTSCLHIQSMDPKLFPISKILHIDTPQNNPSVFSKDIPGLVHANYSLQVNDPTLALALIVQASAIDSSIYAHHELVNQINLLASQFEWLHHDVQIYILKYLNTCQSGLILDDLIHSGKLSVTNKHEKLIIGIKENATDIYIQDTPVANIEDLAIMYNCPAETRFTINTGEISVGRADGVHTRDDECKVKLVQKRYKDVQGSFPNFSIPSLDTDFSFENDGNLKITCNSSTHDITELVHILT